MNEYRLFKNAAFCNEFFLCRVEYAVEDLVLTEKMWFLLLISYWEVDTQLKKLISQMPEDAMFKIRRPLYKWLFKSKRMLCANQKSDVNQTCQQSVFSPVGACIRIWCTAGAVEWRSKCLSIQALSLFLPSPCDSFTLSPREIVFTCYCPPHLHSHNSPAYSNCH